MEPRSPRTYQIRVIPALRQIQETSGYLDPLRIRAFSSESGIPLHEIHEVSSFFPKFRQSPPPKVIVEVCRDMACHLAAPGLADQLRKAGRLGVCIEGTSCLGRCDRAPAAVVSIKDQSAERFYLGCTAEQLERAISLALSDTPARSHLDIAHPVSINDWQIDPYHKAKDLEDLAQPDGETRYAAVRKALEIRAKALARATDYLRDSMGWSDLNVEYFKAAVERQMQVDFAVDERIRKAVLEWQSEEGWAKGKELGGWSDSLLNEMGENGADLRGMGGAGIPTATKWRDVRDAVRAARRRQADNRAFIIANGDESEPGTFKDRELLLRAPHLVVEGVILAGLLAEATEGFIYIRHEYVEQIEACRKEIQRAEKLGFCGGDASALGRPFPLSVFVSPGGYICGEQSALVEALSDHRAEPRNIPPKLETNGLDDRPTVVNNVETFAWTPFIIINGGEAYARSGVNGCKGRRFFSVSGDVKSPGVYEVPMGMTLRELIMGEKFCRGIIDGRKMKAIAPSGPSGGFLPAKLTAGKGLPRKYTENKAWQELAARRNFPANAVELDILDLELELNLFRALSPTQALGGGIVIYAEGRNMVDQAVNAVEFFKNESCGKCVPCRIGSQKLAAVGRNLLDQKIDASTWGDQLVPLIRELSNTMELTSLCALGRSAPVALRTALEFFPDDLKHYVATAPKNETSAER